MFTVKYEYQDTNGENVFVVDYADKVERRHSEKGSHVMIYRYPTSVWGKGRSIVETMINIGGEGNPHSVFVENIATKTVQHLTPNETMATLQR